MRLRSDSEEAGGTHSSAGGLSVVIPALNEATNLERLCTELEKILSREQMPWEIVIVDDGSTDNTWSVITSLAETNGNTKGVRLSRNFGHQAALLAGLQNANGSAVISMDADLQHPPEVIPILVSHWRNGSKIVHTIRSDSQRLNFFKRLTSRIFYSLFSYLSGVDLKRGMADFRLLDRQVLDDILKFQEDGLFLRGIVNWVGYPSSTVKFESPERFSGATKYTFKKMLKLAWRGVSSFSIVPLRVGIVLGLGSSLLSFLGILYAIYSKFIAGDAIPGWASTIAILSLLFGILFFYLGLLGEYLGRVHVEVRRRPRFLVSEVIDLNAAPRTRDASIRPN